MQLGLRYSCSNCLQQSHQLYQDEAEGNFSQRRIFFPNSRLSLCEITEAYNTDYAQVFGKCLAHHDGNVTLCILLALLFHACNAFILIFERISWITMTEMKIESNLLRIRFLCSSNEQVNYPILL